MVVHRCFITWNNYTNHGAYCVIEHGVVLYVATHSYERGFMISKFLSHQAVLRTCISKPALVCLITCMLLGFAQSSFTEESKTAVEEESRAHVSYTEKGFEFGSADGNYLMQLQARF